MFILSLTPVYNSVLYYNSILVPCTIGVTFHRNVKIKLFLFLINPLVPEFYI